MSFEGQPIENLTVSRARDLGIETVYQERALADQQSLWRNIFMGREMTKRFGFLDVKGMKEETEKLMVGSMGFTSTAVAPDSVVRTFSGGEKQGVAIVRALHFEAELIVLDEPTMGLSLSETRKLLEFVRHAKASNKSSIFIDHNVFHVYSVADRIVVLDRGAVAGEFLTKEITLDQLVDKMYRVAQTGSMDYTAPRGNAVMTTSQNGEAGPAIQPSAGADSNPIMRLARGHGQQIAIVGVLIVVWTIFLVGAPETFLSPAIYAAYMSTIPFFAVIAIPLTLVIIAGEIDLSFPSIMAMGMVTFMTIFLRTGSVALALPFALLVGFLIGLSNGWLVVHLGIPSIVVTIGTQFFWRGAALVLTGGGGASLVTAKGTPIHTLMVGRLLDYLPLQMLWTVAIAVATWFLLNRHVFGAHIYLIGDNENSARLMGVNVNRTRMLVFAVVGLAAALGGALSSMEVAYFWPTLGEGYLLRTLAPVFLGGTSVFGGSGTVFGTFIGCFVIGAVEAGIVAIGLTGFWTQLIYGVIIIGSVAIQGILNRRFGNG